MSTIYTGSRLELANEFFVVSSEFAASSTHKHEREKSSSIGLFAVLLVFVLVVVLFFVYALILVPLSMFMYSILNVVMFFAYKNIKSKVHGYSYDYAKRRLQDTIELRMAIKKQLDRLDNIGKFPLVKIISFGIRGIRKKVIKIEKTLENTLYVDMASYNQQDVKKYNEFLDSVKDIWEDDSDLTYAKDTHKLLKDQHVQKH